jgi:hypothetical protein
MILLQQPLPCKEPQILTCIEILRAFEVTNDFFYFFLLCFIHKTPPQARNYQGIKEKRNGSTGAGVGASS